MLTRKSFLQLTGAATLAAAIPHRLPARQPEASSLKLGLASYSLRKFDLDKVLATMQQLNLKHLALKSFHMPLDSSPAALKKIAKKVQDAGIDLYGAGVIYMKSEQEVVQAFEYAHHAGIKVIIGVAPPALLTLVEKQVRQYDIKLAIHNHGPGDDLYPGPDKVYEAVKDLDNRIGLCIDIGHTRRIEQDPAAMARKYADRLYDVHLKDVDQIGAAGESVEFGRGIIDMPAFLRAMQEIQFEGVLGLEYEKAADDPFLGLAESVGYARGVLDTLG